MIALPNRGTELIVESSRKESQGEWSYIILSAMNLLACLTVSE